MQKYLVALALLLAGAAVFVSAQRSRPQSSVPATDIPALIIGKPTAKLTMVVYGDFRCQNCQLFATTIEPQIKHDFVDTGKLKIEWHNFATTPEGVLAAQAVRCSNDQNFFPTYYQALITSTGQLTSSALKKLARQTNDFLNEAQFDSCLDGGHYAQTVKTELLTAQAEGFDTTTYVVGRTAVTGLQPYSVIKPIIEAQL